MAIKTKFELKTGMATREAFGKALAQLGRENQDIVDFAVPVRWGARGWPASVPRGGGERRSPGGGGRGARRSRPRPG